MKKILPLVFLIFAQSNVLAKDFTGFNKNVKNYNKNFVIFDERGAKIADFKIAVADDDEKKRYGLMNLTEMAQENGMLFLFQRADIIRMWMKNTLISLDMIFINGDKIVAVFENATPLSLDIISSKVAADKVLEINSGLVEKYNIKIGQKISYEDS